MVSCWRSTSQKAVAWWRAMTRSWRNGWRQRGQRLHREPQRLYRQVFDNLSPLNCGAVRRYQRLGPRLVGISPNSLPTDTALVGRFGDARVNFFPKKCLTAVGPPGVMSRYFAVSRRTFSLTKSTRCHIRRKNRGLCRYLLDMACVERAPVAPLEPYSYIFRFF